MEEDDMVKSMAIASYGDAPMWREGCKPEELVRRYQVLAEGQPWQPLRAPGRAPE